MLTGGRTAGRTDDGRNVITIAHPEQSSSELKKVVSFLYFFYSFDEVYKNNIADKSQVRYLKYILG